MKVIKRDDVEQDFCLDKIVTAVRKANNAVPKEDQMTEDQISKVIATVQKKLEGFNSIKVEDIQDLVEAALVRHNKYVVAKEYIIYRDTKKKKTKYSETEAKFKAVTAGTSDLRGDNANKHIDDNSSMRDYGAGIVCKSIFEKDIPKDIIKGHKLGWWHWHDSDYSPAQPLNNCDLVDVENMFEYNFQMSDTLIEPNNETPFRTECNLLAQINLQISGRQYGGQTVSWIHVVKSIDRTRKLIRKNVLEDIDSSPAPVKTAWNLYKKLFPTAYNKAISETVENKLKKDIYEGVKTYQYQVLCHCSSSGQTPFVSNNLCLREAENQQELDDFAMLIETILKRRIKGVKNSTGHYVSPLFPKLLYWTCDGLNASENDPYWYLTVLAAECEIKRTQPDIVSERETRRVKKGQIIPSMGCRSLLAPIWEDNTYPIDKEFYWTTGGTYPYSKFLPKHDMSQLESRTYKTGYEEGEICINFRGNTGWLLEKTDTHVTIRQPKVYGRWNNGVVTINLPHAALTARQNVLENPSLDIMKEFYKILNERLEIVHKALKIRSGVCENIKAKNSAILWQHGALARLQPEETVGDLMRQHPERASISLGFTGLFETCQALINESNTTEKGQALSIEILTHLNNMCNIWKESGDCVGQETIIKDEFELDVE